MIWDLVDLILPNIPEEFTFIKFYCVLFVLYIFICILKGFIDVLKSYLKGL